MGTLGACVSALEFRHVGCTRDTNDNKLIMMIMITIVTITMTRIATSSGMSDAHEIHADVVVEPEGGVSILHATSGRRLQIADVGWKKALNVLSVSQQVPRHIDVCMCSMSIGSRSRSRSRSCSRSIGISGRRH